MNRYLFSDASTLIECIKKNRDFLNHERINDIYTIRHNIITDGIIRSTTPIVIIFDSFVVQIEPLCTSVIAVTSGTKQEYEDGEFTEDILGYTDKNSTYTSFGTHDELSTYKGSYIKGISLGIFHDEYSLENCYGYIRPAGGDYFGNIILNFDNSDFSIHNTDIKQESLYI